MRKTFILLLLMSCAASVPAQDLNSFREQFNSFKKGTQSSFREFRNSCNKNYADFLERVWISVKGTAPTAKPVERPIQLYKVNENEQPKVLSTSALLFDVVVEVPKATPQPMPIIPVEELRQSEVDYEVLVNPLRVSAFQGEGFKVQTESVKGKVNIAQLPKINKSNEPKNDKAKAKAEPQNMKARDKATPTAPVRKATAAEVPHVDFTFYGTKGSVRFDKSKLFHLPNVKEISIANAWRAMSTPAYDDLVYDCLKIRELRHLSDWAYLNMLHSVADAICGADTNESVLLMGYIYCQSGYKMRFSRDDYQKLHLLYASDHVIYDIVAYGIPGDPSQFYMFGAQLAEYERNYICNAQFEKEQPLSLLINGEQFFDEQETDAVTHRDSRYTELSTQVKVNKNMLEFYNTYPSSMIGGNKMTRWAMYANTPISSLVREQLYPVLQSCIKGLSQKEAVGRLLHYIQSSYDYKFDDEVWGHDRAFFPDETLFYPYCDCEDRSILLTRLVRDLIGLRCILIYYPGHLACAVEFTDAQVPGDYIETEGHRYTITDPTYIVAPVGLTMKGMNNQSATIIMLN